VRFLPVVFQTAARDWEFFVNGPDSARTSRATIDEARSGACVAADTNYGDRTWPEAIGLPTRPVTSMSIKLPNHLLVNDPSLSTQAIGDVSGK
jgi:hypothetical protein